MSHQFPMYPTDNKLIQSLELNKLLDAAQVLPPAASAQPSNLGLLGSMDSRMMQALLSSRLALHNHHNNINNTNNNINNLRARVPQMPITHAMLSPPSALANLRLGGNVGNAQVNNKFPTGLDLLRAISQQRQQEQQHQQQQQQAQVHSKLFSMAPPPSVPATSISFPPSLVANNTRITSPVMERTLIAKEVAMARFLAARESRLAPFLCHKINNINATMLTNKNDNSAETKVNSNSNEGSPCDSNSSVSSSDHGSQPNDSASASASSSCASPSSSLFYITEIGDLDVLCGRGGKSNHHAGNKRYRQVINDMKLMYRNTEAKTVKTDLSRAIVDHVCSYGGRFVKKDEATGRYFILTKSEARKKTSQALRETKQLKWTV